MSARIAILTNNAAPYRNQLLQKVAELLAVSGHTMKVVFMREREGDRRWNVISGEMNYPHEVLRGLHIRWPGLKEVHVNPGLWVKLVRENPHVVIIGGYNSLSSWLALAYCKLYGRKALLWSGSTLPGSKHQGGLVGGLRRVFVRACDAHVAYGTRAAEFLNHFGAARDRVFVGCNVGDVGFFLWKQGEQRDPGAQDGPRLIFVGQLGRRKGIENLIVALARLRDMQWSLDVVGDGPRRANVRRLIEKACLGQRVSLRGFQQKEELRELYRRADIFVLPSLADPFSIVVSEALASGLYVVASKYDGASVDIVRPGENGVVTDPADMEALTDALRQVIGMWPRLPSRQAIAASVSGCQEMYARQFSESVSFVLSAAGSVR